jgi:2-phospho-L-lactate guanylyltransferase
VEVRGDLASLRQDVDDVGDLGRAMVLGVGPHTADAMGHGAI